MPARFQMRIRVTNEIIRFPAQSFLSEVGRAVIFACTLGRRKIDETGEFQTLIAGFVGLTAAGVVLTAPFWVTHPDIAKRLLVGIASITGVLAGLGVAGWVYVAQPTLTRNRKTSVKIDLERLKSHVVTIATDFYPRNHLRTDNLDATAKYIESHFRAAGADPWTQELDLRDNCFRNVIASFGAGPGKRLIIGAHYDSCSDTPGADDNASAVAGLIELAYLFGKVAPKRRVELAAYTLEEPPHFATEMMGSYVHAERVSRDAKDIEGVIVLEMIGYFCDEPDSQQFPISAARLIYPSKGNFVGVIGNSSQRRFTRQIKNGMKGTTDLPVFSINAPSSVPGIDFSDHRNYWKFGINAVMITDMAFYRNPNYHQITDTPETLDYKRMADVVKSVYAAVEQFD